MTVQASIAAKAVGQHCSDVCNNAIEQGLSCAVFARAGLQMLDALEGMHRLGFIHRDVKPANFVMFPQWCSNLGSDEGKQDPAAVVAAVIQKRFIGCFRLILHSV